MLGRLRKKNESSSKKKKDKDHRIIPGAKTDIKTDYHIDASEIGSGTFATVRRCRHRESGNVYAVKIISKKSLVDKDHVMLQTEVDVLRNVSHESCVKMYDCYESKHHIYMVLELCTGGELFDQIVERGHFSEADAAVTMTQIFSALEYLHARNIVHRDLKPENVLCATKQSEGVTPVVKIADFGLSKVVGHETTLKTACGSPSYVAPEVLSQSYNGYTDEVDLWSAGVIMYILLCGFPPFYSEDTPELFEQIQQGRFDFPSPYWDSISDSAKDLVNNLLVVDPDQRLSAVEALQHPWIASVAGDAPDAIDGVMDRMSRMNNKRKFKKAIFAVLAANDTPSSPDLITTADLPAIDNSELLDETGELVDDLVEGSHFRLLHGNVYRLFHSRCGGGPEIKRSVIAAGESCRVEIYPLKLHLLAPAEPFGPDPELATRARDMGWLPALGALPVQQPLMARTVSFSRAVSIHHLVTAVCWLEGGTARIAVIRNSAPSSFIDDPALTLTAAGIQCGDTLFLDFEVDGVWLLDTMLAASVESAPAVVDLTESSPLDELSVMDDVVVANAPVPPGLMGLANLGNTCFMNAVLQTLAHLPALRDQLLADNLSDSINTVNPHGTKGKLAYAFADLVKTLWSGAGAAVAPRHFKQVLNHHAPRFVGSSQHDAGEVLTYVLDGLHEDLNRSPYALGASPRPRPPPPDTSARDQDLNLSSMLAWSSHLARDESVIVDVFEGQLISRVACTADGCGKASVTFDPFRSLQLELPVEERKPVGVGSPASRAPVQLTLRTVAGPFEAFGSEREALQLTLPAKPRPIVQTVLTAVADELGVPSHTLRLASIKHSRVVANAVLGTAPVADIAGDLVVFRLPTDRELKASESVLVSVSHRTEIGGECFVFGEPSLAVVPANSTYDALEAAVFQVCSGALAVTEQLEVPSASSIDFPSIRDLDNVSPNALGLSLVIRQLSASGRVLRSFAPDRSCVLEANSRLVVDWATNEGLHLRSLLAKSPVEVKVEDGGSSSASVSSSGMDLVRCLELFTGRETLDPSAEWRCEACNVKGYGARELALDRLPRVLVIQLKRFQSHQTPYGFHSTKLEAFIDFPLTGLDLTPFVREGAPVPGVYNLVGVVNHIGVVGGGHYTAYVKHGERDQWFLFDDAHVEPVGAARDVVTPKAYILVYELASEVVP
ncbi:CAMK/CAMK1 protein kinase [Thecamonas trahens ATCC 50062]|uniref:CAMK/CAMK1 protein kinase n=1 Tax=Thecamonas trahens ATCC 50062 TaxID=461836 RepID=A0A0L0DDS5_THETB|nr:CAMK/CAMK1 protein kinase [Thecamonas trahens ATCC 50062]KNC49463.1 CAMK/CAMK1 protein kinase [Thecamonas trahens ATCC 50062]|eukprot:XP_013757882.1 CAMK/CAMK1 protein kinase [Thecamonas trahens ATCC 50062]